MEDRLESWGTLRIVDVEELGCGPAHGGGGAACSIHPANEAHSSSTDNNTHGNSCALYYVCLRVPGRRARVACAAFVQERRPARGGVACRCPPQQQGTPPTAAGVWLLG
jgi:hypothetical protein